MFLVYVHCPERQRENCQNPASAWKTSWNRNCILLALITCNLSLGELFPVLYTLALCCNNSMFPRLYGFIYLTENLYENNRIHIGVRKRRPKRASSMLRFCRMYRPPSQGGPDTWLKSQHCRLFKKHSAFGAHSFLSYGKWGLSTVHFSLQWVQNEKVTLPRRLDSIS